MIKNKGNYIDGFVLLVPKKNLKAYHAMAKEGGKIWMKCGALEYKECVGEDMKNVGMGGMKGLTFPKLAGAGKGDTVWFSFITYKSRAHRDQVNKKVMAEMKKQADKYKDMKMPFDMNKMAYGGFKVEVGY